MLIPIISQKKFLCLLIILSSCNNTKQHKYPEISFTNDTVNLGQIHTGDSIVAIFHYKNSGSSNLKINDIGLSCGCTKVFYDSTECLPTKEGIIKVTFSAGNDTGYVIKSLVVNTNSKRKLHVLYLKGIVIKE